MTRMWLSGVVLLLLAVPASAASILQFTEAGGFNTPFVFTENSTNTATTLTASTPIDVAFDPSFCLVVGCGGVSNGIYDLALTATSLGPASINGSAVSEPFGGTLAITNGAVDLLTVNFTDLLLGSLNGSSPTLEASQPPDLFSGMSTVLDPTKLGVPRGFALSFSDMTGGGLGVTGTSIRSGVADGTGTFSATPTAVPEPTTLLLFGTGVLGLLRWGRRRGGA